MFLQKLGISFGLAFSNFALEAAGYVNEVSGQPIPVQPERVLTALRVFVGPLPAVLLLLSFLVVRAYPSPARSMQRCELSWSAARQGNRQMCVSGATPGVRQAPFVVV